MFVDVRLFAMLRERAGSESVTVEVPDGATVARRGRRGRARARARATLIARMPVVMAVNREYARRRRDARRGRRAGADPAGQRGRGGRTFATGEGYERVHGAGRQPRPAPARTTSTCSACGRCTPSRATCGSSSSATEQFLNPAGVVQGGFITAMLDETMGPAALSRSARAT